MRSMADKSTTNLVGLRSPEFNSSLECLDVQKKGSVVGNESFLTSGKVQILSSASITSDFQGQVRHRILLALIARRTKCQGVALK